MGRPLSAADADAGEPFPRACTALQPARPGALFGSSACAHLRIRTAAVSAAAAAAAAAAVKTCPSRLAGHRRHRIQRASTINAAAAAAAAGLAGSLAWRGKCPDRRQEGSGQRRGARLTVAAAVGRGFLSCVAGPEQHALVDG